MIPVNSTVTQAVTATSSLTSVIPEVNVTGLTSVITNVTSAFIPTVKDLFRNPTRITSHIDQTFIDFWNRFVPESLGGWRWLGTGVNPAVGGTAAQTMADAAVQPVAQALGETGPASWAAFFAEVFQASTFKSYWGMLHYLTSRWAFTCFAMVSLLSPIRVV